ncbi:autotransporter outer membrane beta-barrel domain-containing protein [Microvirgula aerodenitrificans]|uniref:autotransporter outer membrane beta-barrel domain-containing protein n=2 Tax=Bacteria TaxID=2 RepID=UPI0012EC9811|nr:autotransporter outer membrane beta-barrel domain-containing protein [Microvirgula aerodenitrificans]
MAAVAGLAAAGIAITARGDRGTTPHVDTMPLPDTANPAAPADSTHKVSSRPRTPPPAGGPDPQRPSKPGDKPDDKPGDRPGDRPGSQPEVIADDRSISSEQDAITAFDGTTVVLKGTIRVHGTFPHTPTVVRVDRGGTLNVDEAASLDTAGLDVASPVSRPSRHALMQAAGQGSMLRNNATLTLPGGAGLAAVRQARVENHGLLSSRLSSPPRPGTDGRQRPPQGAYALAAIGNGSGASNSKALFVSLSTEVSAHQYDHLATHHVPSQFSGRRPGITAMVALNGGRADNEAGATIQAEGIGAGGMSASNGNHASRPHSIARNLGSITVNPAIGGHLSVHYLPITGDAGDKIPLAPYEYAAGMSVGSREGNQNTRFAINAVAINKGTITVHNAGVGMVASGEGGLAINQGTIRLVSDPGVETPAGSLFGMQALNHATILNDHDGTIEISTPAGKAFRRLDGGMLLNRGKVLLLDSPVAPGEPAWGSVADAGLTDLAGEGDLLSPEDGHTRLERPRFSPGIKPETAPSTLRNPGNLSLNGHRLTLAGKDTLSNTGTIGDGTITTLHGSALHNRNLFDRVVLRAYGPVYNEPDGHVILGSTSPSLAFSLHNAGRMYPGQLELHGEFTNVRGSSIHLTPGAGLFLHAGVFSNAGDIRTALRPDQSATADQALLTLPRSALDREIINTGTITMANDVAVLRTTAASRAATRTPFINRGTIRFDSGHRTTTALEAGHNGLDILNDTGATLEIDGDKAVGMYSDADAQLVNRGTITVGKPGSPHTGLVAMALGPHATGTLVNDSTGLIIINAGQSHAFHIAGPDGALVNRGKILLQCGKEDGCDTFRDASTRARDMTGTETDRALIFPPRFLATSDGAGAAGIRSTSLDHYQIGTSASSAGTLSGDYLALGHDVRIDTGFTAGTSARQQVYPKLVTGKGLSGAGNIRSTTVVWEARGYHDNDGDIGVTLVKNDYRDLIADASLAPVASALERSYGRGRLFSSLELPGREDFARALRQLSGAGFDRSLRAVPTLEHRFDRMADSVAEDATGFGFRLLGRGERGSRLGASAYDMVALQQRFAPGTAQLAVRYGFARVSPGSSKDREQGLDGSSQYLGARYARPLTTGLAVEGHLDYFLHQYRTRRTLDYGTGSKAVNYRARADHRRDQLGARLNLALAQPVGGAVLTPLLGVRLRYQRDGALRERDAGAFGLRVTSRHDVALEALLGLRFSHDGRDSRSRGWQLDAQFHGRPAMLRQAGRREASLAGAPDARFALAAEDGRRRFGYDGRLGFSHQGRHGRFSLEGYLSRDDGSQDRGVMANWRLLY